MHRRTGLSAAVGVLAFLLGLLFAITLEAERTARTGMPTWLPYVATSPVLTTVFYQNLTAAIGFLLSPLLVFTVGFVFGRRIDVRNEYAAVLGSLLLGSVIGFGLGRVAAVLVFFGLDFPIGGIVGLVVPALLFASARTALIGFAGVALGHFRSTSISW